MRHVDLVATPHHRRAVHLWHRCRSEFGSLALWVFACVATALSVNPFDRKSLITIGIGSAGGSFGGHSIGGGRDCDAENARLSSVYGYC